MDEKEGLRPTCADNQTTKGKLKGQLQSAQVTLLACRSASGPHLVAHRFCGLDSKILGHRVKGLKDGVLEKAQTQHPQGRLSSPSCTFPATASVLQTCRPSTRQPQMPCSPAKRL